MKREELIPNTFVFDSLTLACGGDDIYWLYSQNNTKPIIASVESATFNNTELRLSWLDINITKQGYYGCVIFNKFYEEIGVFDPSLTTGEFSNSYFLLLIRISYIALFLVAVPGNTYTYIIGIDRHDVQLLCDPMDNEYLLDVEWIAGGSYDNPLNIFSKLEGFPSESTKFCCRSGGNEILSIFISAKSKSIL